MRVADRFARFAHVYSTSLLAYLAVACVSAAMEWISFAVIAQVAAPIFAALLGFAVATSANFVLSRVFVFRSKSFWVTEFGRVLLASAAVFAWNLLVFYLLYRFAAVPLIASKIIGTIAGFALNFFVRQFWVFSVEPRYTPITAGRLWGSRE